MKKKILIFSHEFPPMQGGEGTYAFELAKALNQLNFEVHVLAGTVLNKKFDSKIIDDELSKKGILITRYDWVNKDRFWFLTWQKIFLNYIKNHSQFDNIFFANFSALVVGHRLSKKILNSFKYSTTLHGDDIFYFFSNRKFFKSLILINHFKKNYFFQRSQNNICVSEHAKNMLHRYTKKFKVSIVHHGIEEKVITNLPKIDSKKKFIFVYPSRIEKMKGQKEWIDIVDSSQELKEKIFTIFIGDGTEKNNIENYILKKKLTDNFKFLGQIPRDTLLEYIKKSDIVISLSNHPSETFGIIILESMMLKKAIILFNRPVLKSILNSDEAWLVNYQNASSKISELINNNKNIQLLAKKGYERYKKDYRNTSMANKTCKILNL